MQKLGEKLQTLVAEARPLLKDLNQGLKDWKQIERDIHRALEITMEKAREAAEIYKLCKALDVVMTTKLDNVLMNSRMVDAELNKLQEFHRRLQVDIGNSLSQYNSHMVKTHLGIDNEKP
jgi:hypothetical protein